jgi:hypothetical protein
MRPRACAASSASASWLVTATALRGSSAPSSEEEGSEIAPVDEAHGDEEHAVDLPRLVHRHDPGVLGRRRELRLAQKPRAKAGIVGQPADEQLERDAAPQPLVLGPEHHSHPALPQPRGDPIRTERRADAGKRFRGHDRRDLAASLSRTQHVDPRS